MNYRPSGSMCKVCMHCYTRNCSDLDFASMPAMRQDKDGVTVVRCVEFVKLKGGTQ